MTYDDALTWLYARLPMFTRIGNPAYRPGLDNIRKLSEHLGAPHQKLMAVHIAGTNGKGSVSSLLASICMEAGLKTGLYTSPHLRDFRERIRINGKKIPRKEVVRFVRRYGGLLDTLKASFFEATTAMALDHFAHNRVDLAVIETGVGGRLDSTNIIHPRLSIITNISWDHKDLLGDTLEKIAFEKAGIIKPGVPVVVGEHHEVPAVDAVFRDAAASAGSPLLFAADHWQGTIAKDEPHRFRWTYRLLSRTDELLLKSPLCGPHQLRNLITVCAAAAVMQQLGFPVKNHHITAGVAGVLRNSGLRGRWQRLKKQPLVIADVAHNEAGLTYVLPMLRQLERPLRFVIGFVADKELDKMLRLFPQNAVYYFCSPAVPRGLPVAQLADRAQTFGLSGNTYPSVIDALNAAVRDCSARDVVFVGGSTFVVAEVA